MPTTPVPAETASSPLAQFDFDLPPELIAQEPAAQRDASRLMVLDRDGTQAHDIVRALPNYLEPGDLLVVNDTRVLPARLRGRVASGGRIELLAVRPSPASDAARTRWICLARPARRLLPNTLVALDGGGVARVVRRLEDGRCELELQGDTPFVDYLQAHGEVPLPPYIRRPHGPQNEDRCRYQTIFASKPGAIAAPTAGLHFTFELLQALEHRGVQIAALTLHVGPGTFMPIRDDALEAHTMEAEWYEIPAATAAAIAAAKARRSRVVAVGTTTTRALESAALEGPPAPSGAFDTGSDGALRPGSGWAGLFIRPGHRFRVIDALFTNFHLPRSTLMLLVAAFAGTDRILAAYREAVARRYRFYSYGDAMLLR